MYLPGQSDTMREYIRVYNAMIGAWRFKHIHIGYFSKNSRSGSGVGDSGVSLRGESAGGSGGRSTAEGRSESLSKERGR